MTKFKLKLNTLSERFPLPNEVLKTHIEKMEDDIEYFKHAIFGNMKIAKDFLFKNITPDNIHISIDETLIICNGLSLDFDERGVLKNINFEISFPNNSWLEDIFLKILGRGEDINDYIMIRPSGYGKGSYRGNVYTMVHTSINHFHLILFECPDEKIKYLKQSPELPLKESLI